MAVPSIQARYLQIYRQLVEKVFVPQTVEARMAALREIIRPYVVSDPQKLMTLEQFDGAMNGLEGQQGGTGGGNAGGGFGGGSVIGLKTLIDARVPWLKSQLSAALPAGSLYATRNALNFTMGKGGTADSQIVRLSATGVETVATYSVSSATTTGGTWLSPLPTGGALPGSFAVSVDGRDLEAGSYTGSVSIYLTGAKNSPITIPVNLTVTAPPPAAISAVTNAASYAAGAVAPGEIVVLFGTGLGPASLTTGTAGATVLFDGVTAQVVYSRADQVSAVVPMEAAGKGATEVKVSYAGQTGTSSGIAVQAANPGIFTLTQTGRGQGAILNQDSTINGTANPAAKGSVISIYLTGAGILNGSSLAGAVSVTIGGLPAAVQFAGTTPGSLAGLYQINAAVPADASSGELPVAVTVAGFGSQSGVTVAVQ